jgi:hypothetical protein
MPDLVGFAEWLIDLLLYIPRQIYSLFIDGLIAVFNGLFGIFDVSWMTSATIYLGGVPSGVLWFLSFFQFEYGLSAVFSALGLRFLIRRMPVIG